jgi:hypothetical protein
MLANGLAWTIRTHGWVVLGDVVVVVVVAVASKLQTTGNNRCSLIPFTQNVLQHMRMFSLSRVTDGIRWQLASAQ